MSGAPTLGIIAGGGRLPVQLIESCQASGRPCFVLALENSADVATISHVPHAVVRIGAIGEALDHLHKAHVKDLVLAGHVRRPSISSLRPDLKGATWLARLMPKFFFGDDTLLTAVIALLEEEGFRVVGSDDILKGLIAPEGVLGKIQPDARAVADIAHGVKAARTLGEMDIGQAAIVENGYVLGVETAEGTDALIDRCGKLRREMRSGVLVKIKKPGQENRVDLPAIGVQTVEKIHAAGFAGIAIEAGGGIILDRDKTIAKANQLGLFIVGIKT